MKEQDIMSEETEEHRAAPRGLVLAAFAAIYLIWGSTYLAIRFAVETIPPCLLGGARFLLAGGVLYAWLRLKGVPISAGFHWRNAAVVGVLLLGFGNGGVNWAEQNVPSGLTALIIAVTPVWFALLDWLRPRGTRPSLQTVIGIVVGFAGVALLVGGPEIFRKNAIHPAGVAALMVASVAWASGSLYARYTPKPDSPLMAGAMQMLTGGGVLLITGILWGETGRFDLPQVSARSAWAFAYLAVIGSLVGFTAFSWLLKVSTPARISTYAYVNPVIAVFLGWAIGGETLSARMMWAAAVIVLGVVIITTRRTPLSASAEETEKVGTIEVPGDRNTAGTR
ncbi:MAG TPA: drug/metabolite exporter YedA [Verrucomicrobiae bacterium]|nr:drug/metabolite exporter YedA [Verrucomicrobiae bacterium]